MTEEERERLERQKDWVKHRINCTTRAVFDRLVDAIKYDINTYNESDTNQFNAEDMTGGDPGLIVTEVTSYGDPDFVTIVLKKSFIRVKHREQLLFTVTPHWNEADLECNLLIDGDPEPHTYPQISQKAIGGLLFKGPTYPPTMGGG
ncbi:MAG: hypothetical protein OXD39_13345 [Gemmatimonadetes bacterium]|nr:hypothetical protein [Gemmatimonadota bacterium]